VFSTCIRCNFDLSSHCLTIQPARLYQQTDCLFARLCFPWLCIQFSFNQTPSLFNLFSLGNIYMISIKTTTKKKTKINYTLWCLSNYCNWHFIQQCFYELYMNILFFVWHHISMNKSLYVYVLCFPDIISEYVGVPQLLVLSLDTTV
jgi:hypothetical protein